MFIWEWGKENVQVLFSDKDLSEIRNTMSEDISNSNSKHRQDVRDSRYTKQRFWNSGVAYYEKYYSVVFIPWRRVLCVLVKPQVEQWNIYCFVD